ncbi:Wzz/FepE/Etk N-terminal domain-containing protein [Pseudoalteromonas sp. SR45-4]|uniref:Wzz/FepE/Etk N-terminal domain-containing protein n=1 Tax=Pseudoalteromonas sp. SR45-4 TaxID=2760929 RepID=UPI0015FB8CA8|nr:Wzz/FepE/Etk N-terminal domain-containing protein [Pseudoalteromonas sp. SR45-4]MBB1369949.1 LPS O-antigen length regulator [Pseudoalteromonas sp. SR45-4]
MENYLDNQKKENELAAADDEIDLRELFAAIWQGKWSIIVITTLFAVASVFYAINLPNIYKSEALLAPAEQNKATGIAGQLGGLASLAGVSLGAGGGVDKTQMALEILKSRKFITEFIDGHQILPDLMAVKSWDRSTNILGYNPEVYDSQSQTWLRDVKPPLSAEPSMQEAYNNFSNIMKVNVSQETSLVTISIEHLSPIIARNWVDWLIKDINLEMKKRDINEAQRSTSFLTEQIEQTKVADIRAVLYGLIEEQTKTQMFANARDEYVFKTIDPAIVAEQKAKPKRALICILGFILGAALGVMYVLLRYFYKKD